MNIDIKQIIEVARINNYPLFIGDKNPNVWCIRSSNQNAGYFDDYELVFTLNTKMKEDCYVFNVTCDPSDLSLIKMSNPLGCAIIKEGHHKGIWSYGFHKQDKSHPALVQVKPCIVIRDFNKDSILDNKTIEFDRKLTLDNGLVEYYKNHILLRREQTGIFGINNHRASAWQNLVKVGPYSEGCVVHQDPDRYNKEFIYMMKLYSEYANTFSLTLITQETYESVN